MPAWNIAAPHPPLGHGRIFKIHRAGQSRIATKTGDDLLDLHTRYLRVARICVNVESVRPLRHAVNMSHISDTLTELRQRSGLSLSQTARAMGKAGPSSIQRYFLDYRDETLDLRIAREFAAAWVGRGNPPITEQEVLALAGVGAPTAALPQTNVSGPIPAPSPVTMPLDVPVMGTAVGGSGGDFTFNNGVVDYARRPPGVARNRAVFCVFVRGDSMEPRFEPGDLLYVNPSRPARAGDDVLVELHPDQPGEPGAAFIKRLEAHTPTKLILKQFNPAKKIELPIARVLRVCPILRANELLSL